MRDASRARRRRPPASRRGSGRRARGACSATTKAMATPSVWVSDRWKVPAPRAPASSAAEPCSTRYGRVARGALPRRPAHLDVGQREAADAGAERLHHRLLGGEARRQALGHVGRPAGVGALGLGEAPRGEAGRRSSTRRNRATSTASTPTPTMAPATPAMPAAPRSLDGHRLGQVAGAVGVVPVQAGQAVGQLLQRHHARPRARAAGWSAGPTARGRPRRPTPRRRRRPAARRWRRGCAPRRCWTASSPTAGCAWRCRRPRCPARSARSARA